MYLCPMITAGEYHTLTVLRKVEFGLYLDDGDKGILLPNRFVPSNAKPGDSLKVFIYHDSEDRLIATTENPKAIAGEIVKLKVVSITEQGAFMDMGLMKDLFVPLSQQKTKLMVRGEYLVNIYIDKRTGRMAGTEKFDSLLSNEALTVKEKEIVDLIVYRRTDIGYVVIINNIHTGILHHNEIYRSITSGDKFQGFIKKIYSDNRIDVAAGKPGIERVLDATGVILQLLNENEGFLPYHDKSNPDDIYAFFGISKKNFKMTIGNLFRQKLILIESDGIRLVK